MSSRHGKRLASLDGKNWTADPVSTHRGKFVVGSKGNNWTINPVSIHRGKITVRSVSNTWNRPPMTEHILRSFLVGNHCGSSTASHIGHRQVKDTVCSILGFTSLGFVTLLLSYFIFVRGDWQVRSVRRSKVRSTHMDNPTGMEVRIGREIASLLPPTPAVRCRGSVSRPSQVSSVLFLVSTRSRHFHKCRRMSLPYRIGQAMCRKPHQESRPTSKALVHAEVTRQDTEHNTVSPVPLPRGSFGHNLCLVL